MVRRGSTVRVRQRALQKRRKQGFFFRARLHDPQRAVGMEPFVEPSAREVSPLGAKSGDVAIRDEHNRDLFDLERQSWAFSTFWAASGACKTLHARVSVWLRR